MKLTNLRDLLIDQLRDLHSAETQLLKALPKMRDRASHLSLKQAFDTHLEETKLQVRKLDELFKAIGESAGGHTCKAMKGIIAEAEELMDYDAPDEVMDAGLIAAAQRVEHYEIAGYGTVREYADELGADSIAAVLKSILEQEKRTDKKLTLKAISSINQEAQRPGSAAAM
jgi:ferritin-like metal-binding protein YciE